MSDLLALAERVQALTCACREMDALIWCALEPTYGHRTSHPDKAPEFTASLDAAMTLVPEGMPRMVGSDGGRSNPFAVVTTLKDGGKYVDRDIKCEAATEPLAIVAAALRARAASENSHGR